jgi:hypothetical protein
MSDTTGILDTSQLLPYLSTARNDLGLNGRKVEPRIGWGDERHRGRIVASVIHEADAAVHEILYVVQDEGGGIMRCGIDMVRVLPEGH